MKNNIIEGEIVKVLSRKKFVVRSDNLQYSAILGRNFFDYLPLHEGDLVFIEKYVKNKYVILTKTDFKSRGLNWDDWTENHVPKERL